MTGFSFVDNWPTFMVFALNLVIGWALWALRKSFVSKEDHGLLAARVQGVEDRLDQIPGAAVIHQLSIQMTALHGELKATNTRLDGFNDLSRRMQKQLDLIDGFLREHGAGK
jgi:hypothetical protein